MPVRKRLGVVPVDGSRTVDVVDNQFLVAIIVQVGIGGTIGVIG